MAERRPRRTAKVQSDAIKNATFQILGSLFNPIFASDMDEESTLPAGSSLPPHPSPNHGRKQLVPSTLKAPNKKKLVATNKASKAPTIRKPLIVNLSDFQVLSRFTFKASSSRSVVHKHHRTSLDSTRHSSIVMKDNADPNIVQMPNMVIGNLELVNAPILGDPLTCP
ncbi:hypothetical protein V6N13_022903 [Hibiscus sabdariffa]